MERHEVYGLWVRMPLEMESYCQIACAACLWDFYAGLTAHWSQPDSIWPFPNHQPPQLKLESF